MQTHIPSASKRKHAHDAIAIDEAHFRAALRNAPYFSTGRSWSDYAPAYRFGYAMYEASRNQAFEAFEPQLAAGWEAQRAGSRLQWAEARDAVRDAWRHLDRGRPPGGEHRRGHH